MNIPPDMNDPNDLERGRAARPERRLRAEEVGLEDAVARRRRHRRRRASASSSDRSMQAQKTREMHAAVMEQFQDIEKDDVGKFWACFLGTDVDAGMFQDNLALSQRDHVAVRHRRRRTIRPRCARSARPRRSTPSTRSRAHGAREYEPALKKYGERLSRLVDARSTPWSKVAPAQVAEMEVGAKVGTYGAAWHAFARAASRATTSSPYDRFLHCAVPGRRQDEGRPGAGGVPLQVVQGREVRHARCNNECGKELIADAAGSRENGFRPPIKKLAADDRELSAFDDCMRKGRKGKRRDDSRRRGPRLGRLHGSGPRGPQDRQRGA